MKLFSDVTLGIGGHANSLAEQLETDMGADSRQEHLNTVKMTVYLLCQFIDMIESDVSKPSAIISGKVWKEIIIDLTFNSLSKIYPITFTKSKFANTKH